MNRRYFDPNPAIPPMHARPCATTARAVRWGAVLAFALATLAGCADYSTGTGYPPAGPPGNPAMPVLRSIRLSLSTDTIEIGQIATVAAQGIDQFGEAIDAGPVRFSASAIGIVVAGRTTGTVFGLEAGDVEIFATINGVTGHIPMTVVKPPIRINEVVTNGEFNGGFIELINPSDRDIDLGGVSLFTLDVRNIVVLPQGFIIPAHGYQTVSEIHFPLGLGASDAILLTSRFDALLDRFSWVGNPQPNYSRCPELDGPFFVREPTRRAVNDCVNAEPGATLRR